MGKLEDIQIRNWIKADERFEQRGDGDGLYLRYRAADKSPVWLFRYRFKGKQRLMVVGRYSNLSLSNARKEAKELSARVLLGHDVAAEKQDRKTEAVEKIEAKATAITVAKLADQYFERMILGRWKHPNIVRARIEKDIKPAIGHMAVQDVKPMDIDAMLQTIVKRGAPTMANDVLRWSRRIFDFAIKRQMCEHNPAAAFDLDDAGGQEVARDRALTSAELVKLFEAMREAKGFSVENALTIKLLLLLAVRKQELIGAKWAEFDLASGIWYLPAGRIKAKIKPPKGFDIPLPAVGVEWLRALQRLAGGADYVLPARKAQSRMLPHIHENTLNVAMAKVRHGLEAFTIHDLRRTARTHLGKLGIPPHICERCLNHVIRGVEGVYDRYDYFDERKAALDKWADLLGLLESGGATANVTPIRKNAAA